MVNSADYPRSVQEILNRAFDATNNRLRTDIGSATLTFDDDVLLRLGTTGDQVFLNRSTALAADAEITDAIVGTSDHQGLAANSLIVSNRTQDGDIGVYVNNGGNSLEALLIDSSAKTISLGFGSFEVLLGGGTAPTLGAAAVDTVRISNFDIAAGDRELAILTESGGPIYIGYDHIFLHRYLDGASSAPWYEAGRAGGTNAAPTAVVSGVNLGEVTFSGYNGVITQQGSWPVAAEIRGVSLQTFSGTISSGKLVFLTTATGAYNSQVIRMTLEDGVANFTYPGSYTIQVDGYGTSTPGNLHLRGARGTLASPTAVQVPDALGQLYWYGHDGSAFGLGAAIQPAVTETWTTTAHGTRLDFYTVKNTTTATINAIRLDQDSNLLLMGGATTPVLAAAAADTVALVGVDLAAGDRRFYIQSELGSAIIIGNDRLRFAAATGIIGIGATNVLSMTTTSVTLADAVNLIVNATTGTKIGTATTQKLSFWNATPVIQGAAVADASGGATVDAEARTALNTLLARMRTYGLIAT